MVNLPLSLETAYGFHHSRVMKLLIFIAIVIETLIAIQVLKHVILVLIAFPCLRPRIVNSPRHFILLLVIHSQLALTHNLPVDHELLLLPVSGIRAGL